MASSEYRIEDVTVIVNGSIIDGFMSGDFITVAQPEDISTMTFGSHGEVVHNTRVINHATMTLTLMGRSQAIRTLQDLLSTQISTGRGFFSVLVRDINTTNKLVQSTKCKFQKIPDMAFGDDAGSVEWNINMSDVTIRHDGRPVA